MPVFVVEVPITLSIEAATQEEAMKTVEEILADFKQYLEYGEPDFKEAVKEMWRL